MRLKQEFKKIGISNLSYLLKRLGYKKTFLYRGKDKKKYLS